MYLREVERGEATVSCRRGGARDEVLLVLMDVGRVQEGRFEKEGEAFSLLWTLTCSLTRQ
jgi:hypothetical protein